MSFSLGPLLTFGAIEAIAAHGSKELQETYLAKLVSGEWMGTMNLTEPQAGSDLSALRALSGNGWPEPIIKTLAFAQRYVAAIPWSGIPTAVEVLERTNAFIRPEEGDEQGIRLRIPDPADISADDIQDSSTE